VDHPSECLFFFGSTADHMAPRWDGGKRICHGDYQVEADLEHGAESDAFYAHQAKLPTLPVPDLSHTLQLYLDSVRPLASPEEFARTEAAVRDLETGLGPVLQARLQARAQSLPFSSWLQEWWNHDVYLLGRTSLVLDYNFYFHFADDPHLPPFVPNSGTEVQELAAARLLRGVLQYRDSIVAGTAPPEKSRQTPCCCTQYKYVFNACRVPQLGKDEVHLYDPARNNTVCVLRHNKVYTFPTHHSDGRLLLTPEFQTQLRRVITAAGSTTGPNVGVLTSDVRDRWTAAREQLLADGNAEVLEAIQSAVLLLCLDDDEPLTNEDVGRLLLHGGPAISNNRWFDKSLQLIVFGNGKAGLNGEHSLMDAMPTFLLMASVLEGIAKTLPDPNPATTFTDLPSPVHLPFALSVPSLQNIYEASRSFDDRIGIHELKVLHFTGFGKRGLKLLKVSPDAFAQMAIQLAAYRTFGDFKPTYESTATRHFLHGRTETTRSLSMQSRAWVLATERRVSPVVQAQALQDALRAHVRYTRLASKGWGCDRHLLGLRHCLAPSERASIFEDPMYSRSRHWNLSTSSLSNDFVLRMGFGEVVPDGMGVAYNLKDDALDFVVTSRDVGDRWAPTMCHHLHDALLLMQYLCGMARALPPSKL